MGVQGIKKDLVKGLQIGLTAFVICFGVTFLFGLILNFGFMNEINRFVNGSLSENPQPTFSSLLLVVASILNLSVFNSGGLLENGGSMHIGLLIFIILPVLAFWISNRSRNKTEDFGLSDLIEYTTSSIVFSLILFAFSSIAKGKLLGLTINFVHVSNLFMMIVLLLCVQFFIGMNYNKNFNPGIKRTRFVVRSLLIIGLSLAILGMIAAFMKLGVGFLVGLSLIILLAPTAAVYILFTFMGASIEFSDQLMTIFNTFGVDLSFTVLPLPIRMLFILIFFGLIFYSILKLKRDSFIKNIILFAGSFSIISFVLAYITKMNLGFVKGWVDVEFKINEVFALAMPAGLVILAGALVFLIRRLRNELTE